MKRAIINLRIQRAILPACRGGFKGIVTASLCILFTGCKPGEAPALRKDHASSALLKTLVATGDSVSNYRFFTMDSYPDVSESLTNKYTFDEADKQELENGAGTNEILKTAYANRLFNAKKWLESDRGFRFRINPNKISEYDPVIKKMSRRYGFDWRLIAAQIYAESMFETRAASKAGALGLMQVMPGTAKILGMSSDKLMQPHINIAVGCLYDQQMYHLWEKETKEKEQRLAFALASYNAGRARVLREIDREKEFISWQNVCKKLPEETQIYVHRIYLKYEAYRTQVLP
jgi:membrane-bound lytic murein transglycosylase F